MQASAHPAAWLPGQQILLSGDFVIWMFPNAGNPRKVQRYAPERAATLRRMNRLGARVLSWHSQSAGTGAEGRERGGEQPDGIPVPHLINHAARQASTPVRSYQRERCPR